jgi:hypothetical protein
MVYNARLFLRAQTGVSLPSPENSIDPLLEMMSFLIFIILDNA